MLVVRNPIALALPTAVEQERFGRPTLFSRTIAKLSVGPADQRQYTARCTYPALT